MNRVIWFLLPALILCVSSVHAQGFIACIYDDGFQLRDRCAGGNPLPDGTPVYILWDANGNGPDGADQLLPLCNIPPDCPGGPGGTYNMNSFALNGNEMGLDPGMFWQDPCLLEVSPMPSVPRYYLRIATDDATWTSAVFTCASGYNEFDITWWSCTTPVACTPSGDVAFTNICSDPIPGPRDQTSCITLCNDYPSAMVCVGPLCTQDPGIAAGRIPDVALSYGCISGCTIGPGSGWAFDGGYTGPWLLQYISGQWYYCQWIGIGNGTQGCATLHFEYLGTRPQPYISLTSPVGGEVTALGSNLGIQWTSQGVAGNIDLLLNRNYPNGTWESIAGNIANTGFYSWLTSGTATLNARVRARSTIAPNVYGESAANFSIVVQGTVPFVPDTATLLLLHFDQSPNGAQGEIPQQANAISYVAGRLSDAIWLDDGNQLYYAAADNINATQGTIECWMRPEWNGNDNQDHFLLSWGGGGGIVIVKDLGNSLHMVLNRWAANGRPETGLVYYVGDWQANQWHHVAFTWAQDSLGIYVDGQRRSRAQTAITLPSIAGSVFQIGAEGNGGFLSSSVDELRISSVARTDHDIAQSYISGLAVLSLMMTPDTLRLHTSEFAVASLSLATDLGTVSCSPAAANWSSSDTTVARVATNGTVTAVGAGTAIVTATVQGCSDQLVVIVTQNATGRCCYNNGTGCGDMTDAACTALGGMWDGGLNCASNPCQVAPDSCWTERFDITTIPYEWLRGVIQTADCGFVTVGWNTAASGNEDGWLIKTDINGNTLFDRTYGGALDDRLYSVRQLADGGYLAVGRSGSFGHGSQDGWLVRFNAMGDTLWTRTYGTAGDDRLYSLVPVNSGGYALAGVTTSGSSGGYDFWLVRVDSSGNQIWQRRYGGAAEDFCWNVVVTADGGYALAGYTYSFGAGDADFLLVKTNANGDSLWSRTYGGTSYDECTALLAMSDGGLLLAGYTFSSGNGGYDAQLIRADANGNPLWNRTYGNADHQQLWAMTPTLDNGFACAGFTYSSTSSLRVFAFKINGSGLPRWYRSLGGTGANDDLGYGIAQASDSGFVAVGYSDLVNGQAGLLMKFGSCQPNTPVSPQVVITSNSQNISLNWNRVTQSSIGCALRPDSYDIYYSTRPDSAFTFLASMPDTFYVHTGVIGTAAKTFYRVTAADNPPVVSGVATLPNGEHGTISMNRATDPHVIHDALK